MRRFVLSLLVVLALPAASVAQRGFALKGHFVFNSSAVNTERTDTLPKANGIGIGAELVLPMNLGVGVSAYAAGGTSDLDVETTSLTLLGEANYFLKLPLIPVAPYVGVHAGLGSYRKDYPDDVRNPRVRDSGTEFGYQAGVRVQLTKLLGLDAQYRRVSETASKEQGEELERNQVLVGITLF